MTLFLIIYLIGYFASLISLIWYEPQYVTLGELLLSLVESLFSWVTVLMVLIWVIRDNIDTKIIKKK